MLRDIHHEMRAMAWCRALKVRRRFGSDFRMDDEWANDPFFDRNFAGKCTVENSQEWRDVRSPKIVKLFSN